MENSIEFFLNTYLEWSLSRQDLVITSFFLEYGRHPRAGPILVKESPQRDLNDLTYK